MSIFDSIVNWFVDTFGSGFQSVGEFFSEWFIDFFSNLGVSLLQLIWNLCNTFISVMFTPIGAALTPILQAFVTSAQVANFYTVINAYVLPGASFFIHIIPPITWNAIALFISFYVSLFIVVVMGHFVFTVFRVIKRYVPFA